MPGLASNAMIKPFKGAVYSQVWINRNAVDLRTAVCGSIPEEWRKQFSKIRLDQPIQVNRKSRNTNLTDETFQSFPVIGGVSGNHVREIEDMLSSVAVTMPKRGIIIYDIGMSNAKKIFLQSHCNVAVNRIRMDLFGDLVTHIRDYQWKALLVYSAFLKFDGVLFSDASIRYKHSLDELPLVRNGVGYIGMEVRDYSPAGAFTHDGMLEAFGVSRESVATSPTVIGGSHIWFKQGGDVASTVLTHLVACSMRKACIAPEGATLPNCNKTERLSGRYIGCHRFDQSAISVVTEKAFPKGLSNEQCLIEALNFIHVRRRGTGMYPPCIRNSSLSPELV
ncbi:uncharacterized protein LOC135829184 [Sycon ciliatum]|uniref:uncharacterized protein LOC135829184 n=1 Tax=Sycon ciliatum TaxID=27933 RepID=UPI0031F65C87